MRFRSVATLVLLAAALAAGYLLRPAVDAHRAARQHHLHRRRHADEPHRPHGAAETRVNTELHFRQAERQPFVANGDSITARERELQATAEREPLNRGDRGAGQ